MSKDDFMETDDDLSILDAREWEALGRYLYAHRDRLIADRALLARLGLKSASKTLIDFGPAALAKLEARAMRDYDQRRRSDMTIAANYDAQSQTHQLVLSLLEARNLTDLARRLEAEVKQRFGLVTASLALEFPAPLPHGWRRLEEGALDYMIGEKASISLGPEGVCRVLFGDDVKTIQSAAIIRLNLWRDATCGALALGSHDEEGFHENMGTELISFVARVIERISNRWPII